MEKQIRALLVDDCPVLRLGLRRSLESVSDIVVVGEAGDGNSALTMIDSLEPDLVVLNCQLPDMSGVEVAMAVRQKGLQTRIIAFSGHDDEALVRGMAEADVVGYILKDEPPERIIEAIRAAAAGRVWFSPGAAARLVAALRGRSAGEPGLTERETQVLRLLSGGKTNKAVAARLCLTERTVRFHLRNIYDKIGVHARAEAAVWAVRHGVTEEQYENHLKW